MSFKAAAIILGPFAVPAAILAGLALAPAGAFLWLTVRPAGRLPGFFAWVYSLLFAAVVCASIGWPLLVVYGVNQL